MTKDQAQQTAATIAQQLGGGTGRMSAMINARLFAFDADGSLSFSFSGSRKVNRCRVVLDQASDTYTVELFKYSPSKGTCDLKSSTPGVYCDMLQGVFEQETGLYLSL